jgi:precorrin-6A synthase
MRTLLVIGIGPGDPDQITVQAIRGLTRADVVFIVEKGSEADELAGARHQIIDRHLEPGRRPRIVTLQDPPRDRETAAYREAVQDWRRRRADVWEAAIRRELSEADCGAFLVWGDPAIYDSTIAVLQDVVSRRTIELDYEVIPGISSLQALAARHRIGWNRVGGSVQITTGRRLSAGLHSDADDVLVMLDGGCAFTELAEEELEIYWGAYVGTEDEILVAGPVSEVAEEIERLRSQARTRKGWVMDSYLLRRPRRNGTPSSAPRRP